MLTAHIEGLDRLQAGLAAAPSTLANGTRDAMTRSLLLIEGTARQTAAKDTGTGAGSITHTIDGSGADLVGQVGPSERHMYWVEHGRKPGKRPPIRALEGWARRHGIPAAAVAIAIGRHGTRPRPFLAPAFERHQNTIVGLFRAVGVRVVSRIAGGG
jgi:hypothetical protein